MKFTGDSTKIFVERKEGLVAYRELINQALSRVTASFEKGGNIATTSTESLLLFSLRTDVRNYSTLVQFAPKELKGEFLSGEEVINALLNKEGK